MYTDFEWRYIIHTCCQQTQYCSPSVLGRSVLGLVEVLDPGLDPWVGLLAALWVDGPAFVDFASCRQEVLQKEWRAWFSTAFSSQTIVEKYFYYCYEFYGRKENLLDILNKKYSLKNVVGNIQYELNYNKKQISMFVVNFRSLNFNKTKFGKFSTLSLYFGFCFLKKLKFVFFQQS